MSRYALREALERCPFCGSGDAVVHDNGRGLIFNVHCNNCHATGPWERCAADAPHSWNKREALSAPVVSEPWRPIETAPKDGTVIDLWANERLANCYWATDDWLDEPQWRQHYAEAIGSSFPVDVEPTHWMPLPEPPAAIEAMSLAKRNE